MQVLPVTSLSRTDARSRLRNEISVLLESRRYTPVLIVTEPVRLNEVLKTCKIKTFEDGRVKTYRVPNFVVDRLTRYRQHSSFGKLAFAMSNILFQALYMVHVTALLFFVVLSEKAKTIHVHNPPDLAGLSALVVSKVTRTPYVFEIHDRTPELQSDEMKISNHSLICRLLRTIERLVVANSIVTITVNMVAKKHFESYQQRTLAIYNGMRKPVVNPESSLSLRTRFKLKNKRIILFHGTLNLSDIGEPVAYDLELPIRALPSIFKEVPETVLVYVGDGSGKGKLERFVQHLNLDSFVVFTGFVPRHEVFQWINAADVVLVPYADTPNNRTTVPAKLFEYMAVAKPIVATRFEGITEIVTDGLNGLLYTSGSLEEFSQCVLKILKDRLLAEKLVSNVKRDFSSRFSFEKNWPKLISIYDSI